MDKWLEKALENSVIDIAEIRIAHGKSGRVRLCVIDTEGAVLVDRELARGMGYRLQLVEKPG